MSRACTPRRLRQILGGGLGLAMLLTLFIDIAVLAVPIYDMQLYDRVLQSQNMNTLTVLSFACVVGLLIYAVLDYLRGACLIAISEQVGRHLDGAVLSGTIRLAAAGNRKAGPELMRDLNELQSFLASGAVAAPLDALCAPLFLVVMFMLHPAFGCVGIAGISLLVLAGLLAEWLVRAPLLAAQAGRTAAGAASARSLADPELADGLGMLPTIARRWVSRHGVALVRLDRASGQALGLAGLSRCLRFAVQVANMTVGAILVLAGVTTPGSLMGANLLVGKALGPFDHLVSTWRHWVAAHASWRRIEALLRSTPDAAAEMFVAHGDAPPGLLVERLDLLAADGRALLLGIDLHIPPGTLVVLTGPNGAGKTTLLRLLAGLVSPTRGTVLLDGAPIAGGVGFLPQTVSLLEGTLAENIARFHQDALDDAVAAAQRAEVHAPIGRLQHGYDTRVAGNGAALSGGMRQRVGLARALCGSPRLLLLDEPDASLDAEGSAALVRALRESCNAGAIAIVTSHRGSLRDVADLVLTLRHGTLDQRAPLARPTPAQLATA